MLLLSRSFRALAALSLAACATATAATFQYTTPPKELRDKYEEKGTKFDFGYLTVPENRSNPYGRTIRIAVTIFRAERPTAGAPPVFFLTGGPGGSATGYADSFEAFRQIRRQHDLVMIDQRGTGFSVPFLRLDGMDEASIRQARKKYLARGIDLTAYNTTENAADIADLRTALRYPGIVLFGNSYGTFLAQEVMRSHPTGIAAVILNGVSNPEGDFIPHFNHNSLHGLRELFRDVRRTPRARRAFPNLERTYFSLLRRLHRRPLRFGGIKVTLGKFSSTTSALLQSSERVQRLPLVISEIAAGRPSQWLRNMFEEDENLPPTQAIDRGHSDGMYLSVLSTDWNEPGWSQMTHQALDTLRPVIYRQVNSPETLGILKAVHTWDVPYRPRATRTPLHSDIPTLLLNGKMEAQTPPDGGDIVARTLTRAYNLTFPRSGHITGLTKGPALDALLQFLDKPTQRPTYSLRSLTRGNFYLTQVPVVSPRSRGPQEEPLIYMP